MSSRIPRDAARRVLVAAAGLSSRADAPVEVTLAQPIDYWRFPHILLPACQMGDEEWAQLLGISVEDAAAWLDGEREKAATANDRLTALMSIIVALGHVRTGQGIAQWLCSPAPQLDGVRPLDYLAVGNVPGPVILAARQQAAREWGLSEDSAYFPHD